MQKLGAKQRSPEEMTFVDGRNFPEAFYEQSSIEIITELDDECEQRDAFKYLTVSKENYSPKVWTL